MGSPENEAERNDHEIQHQVTLSSFFMGKYPVTQAQWEVIMGKNPSHFKGKNRSVEYVSWEDAVEFCEKLSRETDKTYRLPTESEWEYACRAGTNTLFYFGETITSDLVNYKRNRRERTDVGSFPPNGFGLYDMHGNIWEWCQDWFGAYPTGLLTDPTGSGTGSYRFLRGGSWNLSAGYCRSASRNNFLPGYRGDVLGFRLALSPGQ